MTTRDEWTSAIGEGIHTGFRKGTDHEESMKYHKLIAEMPDELWHDVLCFTVWGLEQMGLIEVEK